MVNQVVQVLQPAVPARSGTIRFYGANVNTNDTITLSDFVTVGNAVAIREDTGATLTLTISGNIVTITSTLTGINIRVMAWGQP